MEQQLTPVPELPEIETVKEIKTGGRYVIVFPDRLSQAAISRIEGLLKQAEERMGCKFMLFDLSVKIYDLDAASATQAMQVAMPEPS